jgi:hypothetical protein
LVDATGFGSEEVRDLLIEVVNSGVADSPFIGTGSRRAE